MQRILLEGPLTEPVTLAEAKAHLRLETAAEDDLLSAHLVAARVAVECDIRKVMIAQEWRAIWTERPERIRLPIPPVLSIDAVRLENAAGERLLEPAEYALREDGGVALAASLAGMKRLEIDFTAGFGEAAEAVPAPLRQAILMRAGHWFENRGLALDSEQAIPPGYERLISPYRELVPA